MNEELRKLIQSLLSDIAAMKDAGQSFGPFAEYVMDDDGVVVEWPNLEISARRLRAAMGESGE